MQVYALATAAVLVAAVVTILVLVSLRIRTRATRRSPDAPDELSTELRATLEEYVRR